LAAVAIILSTVSFLGFGATPPHRDLGLMIAAARDTYFEAWWTATFPAAALALLILCARLAAALEEGERP
jgi:peptide/nickel transport system permease protein